MSILNNAGVIVSIVAGLTAIVGFVFTVIDRRGNRTTTVPREAVSPRRTEPVAPPEATEPLDAVAPEVVPRESARPLADERPITLGRLVRRKMRSGWARISVSPIVFFLGYLGGLTAAAGVAHFAPEQADVDETGPISGLIAAGILTMAWIYSGINRILQARQRRAAEA